MALPKIRLPPTEPSGLPTPWPCGCRIWWDGQYAPCLEHRTWSRETFLAWYGLLDGTSPAFVTSPRDCLVQGGLIGRCATCGELFTCTLFGYGEVPAP